MTDTDESLDGIDSLVDDLHDELAATEELPVSRDAAAWFGEAQAIAADLRDAPRDVIADRIPHVQRLLVDAGDPNNEDVAAHVSRAQTLADRIAERCRTPTE